SIIKKKFSALIKEYETKLLQATTDSEFTRLINDMLAKLNASHTNYYTQNDYEYYHLAAIFHALPAVQTLFKNNAIEYPSIGIITQRFNQKIFVVSVLSGSIAQKAGFKKGDEIISVDGKPYSAVQSLRDRIEKEVVFEIKRTQQSLPVQIVVKPSLINPKQELTAKIWKGLALNRMFVCPWK
ncbi:MAG: S41 family peptidase, partial [bacterium]